MTKTAFVRRMFAAFLLATFTATLAPVTAFADGETPPPPTEPAPTEDAEATEPAVTDEPGTQEIQADLTVLVETPIVEEAVLDEGAVIDEGNTVVEPELLVELPEDTTLVVLDETGQVLPFVTDAAAEVLTTGDPIWCPATTSMPAAGPTTWTGAGCSPSFTTFSELTDWLAVNNPGVAGTIWIEKSFDSGVADPGENFLLDGLTLTNMANFALTLKGGWNGMGTNTVTTTDRSEFNGNIAILNWNGDISLNDLLITNSSGTNALVVGTTKKITLLRVDVITNTSSGARLDNTSSGTGTGDVTVTSSNFSNNAGGTGLEVDSRGVITIASVIANQNGTLPAHDGVNLNNSTAALAKNITITSGSFEFNGNYGTGLAVISKGAVALRDIDSNDNGGYGLDLDNTLGNQGVTISGTNIFSGNDLDGLVIDSRGQITGSNIHVIGNANFGAIIRNNTASSDLGVTFTGTNQFSYNGGGVQIVTRGAITLTNISASNNDTFGGAAFDNTGSTTSASVTLNGMNTFNSNALEGLVILSKGIVTLNKVTANNNGTSTINGFGAHIDNSSASAPKAVILNVASSFSGNFEYGLVVESRGGVSIALLSANQNGGNGAEIDNLASLPASPQNITFTGVGSFNENNGTGLLINTFGTILLGGISASDNNAAGAMINNSTGTMARAVTITGANAFSNNADQGLQVDSLGAITLNNVFADNNGLFGVWLNNSMASLPGNVMVNGTSEFNLNGGYGLNVQSKGNITIYNFDSIENGDFGVQLANNVAGSVGNISVNTTEISWCNALYRNNGTGMFVTSFGNITLSHICSYANAGEGVRVDNSNASGPKPVVITGNNSHNDNDETGLVVLSRGSISISNLYVSGNGWSDGTEPTDGLGAYLYNRAGGTSSPQNISVSGMNLFANSFYSGLEVYTYGSTTLSNVTAESNGLGEADDLEKHGLGVLIDNQTLLTSTPAKSITFLGTNAFTGNWDGGIKVLGSGSIALSNVTASHNIGFGALLTNDFPGASYTTIHGLLSITGSGAFTENGQFGIDILLWGGMTLANLNVADNLAYGATLNAYFGSISLTGSNSFINNEGYGIAAQAPGNIAVNNMYANGNHDFGASLVNDIGTGTITLTGIQRIGYNWADGLVVHSTKAMTFSNLNVHENGGNGATLFSNVSVTLSGTTAASSNNFSDNGLVGLEIVAPATITLTNIKANNNGWEGVMIDNCLYDTVADICRVGVAKYVTITGTNTFNGNGWDGLSVRSLGTISGNNITANNNGGSGAYLDNLWGYEYLKPIILTGTNSFSSNTGPYAGLDMYSNGSISANNVTANGNSGGGVVAWNWSYGNYFQTPAVGVTFTGLNTFNNNLLGEEYGSGLFVKTEGVITLNNVTANGNEQEGLHLDNRSWGVYTGYGFIFIKGNNEFSGNGLNGIYATALGDISLTNVTAELNGQTGLSLDSYQSVTVNCARLNYNQDYGMQVHSPNGTITLVGITGNFNEDGPTFFLGYTNLIQVRTCS